MPRVQLELQFRCVGENETERVGVASNTTQSPSTRLDGVFDWSSTSSLASPCAVLPLIDGRLRQNFVKMTLLPSISFDVDLDMIAQPRSIIELLPRAILAGASFVRKRIFGCGEFPSNGSSAVPLRPGLTSSFSSSSSSSTSDSTSQKPLVASAAPPALGAS